jgi:hypothetical protein
MSARLVWSALLVGCLMSAWAHATEPVTSDQRGPQRAMQSTQIPAGVAPSSDKPGSSRATGAPGDSLGTARPSARDISPVRGWRQAAGTRTLSAKPAVGSAYRSRRPDAARLLRRPVAAAVTTPATNAARLSAIGIRTSSGVFGATGRSSVGKPAAGGSGAVGGPRIPGGGIIGGPPNNRTVIKAGIDGSAFHRRS